MATAQQDRLLKRNVKALQRGGKRARIEALHALGRLDDARAIPALVAALDAGDPDVRAAAMGKLVFLNNKEIVPVLVGSLADKEPRVRQHALYALQRLGASEAADKMAQLLVRDRDETVRLNAALALAAVGGRRHAAAFVQALEDRNRHVVLAALRALAQLAPRQVSSHVLRLVRNTKRWSATPGEQKDVTLRLLRGSLKKRAVVGQLRKIVREGLSEARRRGSPPMSMELMEAACLLAEAGDASGLPVLMEALKSWDYAQERAVKALARLKEKSAVPRIIETALQNGFYTIKLKSVQALGEIGDVRALPALASFFNERLDDFPVERSVTFTKDDPDLRLTALAAMARIAAQHLRQAGRSSEGFEGRLARRLSRAL